jgi:uncharacterized protein (DUF885 family)
MKKQFALLAIGVAMSTAMSARAANDDWKQSFAKVSDEYFDQVYFRYAPSSGTIAGFHQYDDQLEDYSRESIDAEIADLKGILEKLDAVDQEQVKEMNQENISSSEYSAYTLSLNVSVSAEGKMRVLGVDRKHSDPNLTDELIKKGEEAAQNYQIKPARMSNGTPVPVNITIQVKFRVFHDLVSQDMRILRSNVNSQLLTLETIRFWEKDADNYSSACANGAFVLMERKFAPPDDRLRSLIAREAQMPALLAAARVNLKNPPRIYTEIAIEQLPDIISFFQNDVPSAFTDAKDPALKAHFATTNAKVITELQSYLAWLKTDMLPRSNGDFRIGADTFSKKLAYDEMVDTPLDKLLEIGWADLRKNQEHFKQVAKELEPNKDVPAVLEELGANHPAPDHLLEAFRTTFDGLVGFIHSHHIVTIPSEVRPTLEETPPFMRATTTASMDAPGPYETHSTQAYFNVTLPDPKMTPAEVEGYMHSFNIGTIISTAVHEAYPGHYMQYLFQPQVPTKVRKLLGANTDIEGWAHYTEQMMLDEGYGQPGVGAKDERESKFLRLGQLQDALLRNARFIVGIQMHTGHMTFDEAVAFFQKEGYQSKEIGEVEAKRGTTDPTYLYYTLGKLQIMKLREDMKKKQGAAFSLENFHNEFLKQGFPPIKIIREAMLGDESPAL